VRETYLQRWGGKAKEQNPTTAGIYTIWSVGNDYVMSKKGKKPNME